jgi:hypothetical protein
VSQQYSNRMVPLLLSAVLVAFIGWSNPGNVIVRQILKIQAPEAVAANYGSEASEVKYASPLVPEKRKPNMQKHVTKLVATNIEENLPTKENALAALQEYELTAVNNNQYAPTIVQSAGFEAMRDFSIAEPATTVVTPSVEQMTPFVPSSSFSYYIVQDSTRPTTALDNSEEKAANESLQKVLKAIDEIDWKALENGLKVNGEKIDVKKIQAELKKSLKNVDWKKINVEAKIESLKEQTKLNEIKLYNELKASTENNNGQMQEHYKNMEKKIIEDQLKCQQDVQKKEIELKQYLNEKKVKGKKVVEI